MLYFFISKLSIKISPLVASYNLSIKLTVVLFPHPDSPTRAIFFPGLNVKFILFKIILLFSSDGYENTISLKII